MRDAGVERDDTLCVGQQRIDVELADFGMSATR